MQITTSGRDTMHTARVMPALRYRSQCLVPGHDTMK